jgi:hypothetical protein
MDSGPIIYISRAKGAVQLKENDDMGTFGEHNISYEEKFKE